MWMRFPSSGTKRPGSTIEYETSGDLLGTMRLHQCVWGPFLEKHRQRRFVSSDSVQLRPPHFTGMILATGSHALQSNCLASLLFVNRRGHARCPNLRPRMLAAHRSGLKLVQISPIRGVIGS